jgi:acylphosphatase
MAKTVQRLQVRGLVQGVGFRDSLMCEAQRLGLGGWVRNRRDGSVEAVVAGPDEAVQALVTWAHRGPPAARVAEVIVSSVDAGEAGAPGDAAHGVEAADLAFEGFAPRPTA